ncbi:uncharacterized protein BJ212DRAFT_1382660 [Suillus subaureus]|uniref:DUF6699 domain-containing protein n=1 Tax=Suillus subaureus TaxID=48587 RepID=A0A9P7E1A8_9AGAM|nr:uncharacterized protein BJ212DRAFT_1382660 [Suillus subaureus]KAG1808700.1 hypothetical protein BJ212DRAFT_1382660 [Suillus subaureus]
MFNCTCPSICITHLCNIDMLSAHPLRPNRLRHILQVNSGMRYDVRKPTQEGIASSTWQQISHLPALLDVPTFNILIISKAFPWSIVIRAPAGSVVTCGAIFEELHKQLQRHIEDSEWGTVAVDKTRREAIQKAAKSRQEKDKVNRLKRVDWLGDTSMFEGLEKDKEFEKQRHLPGNANVTETWVVRFGKR